MTDEQINAAIADATGWTAIWGEGCDPDYCNDLNEMHEAEKVLTEHQRESIYPKMMGAWKNPTKPIYATARQRAEAFLHTMGLWRATDKESLTVGGATTEQSSADQKEVQK